MGWVLVDYIRTKGRFSVVGACEGAIAGLVGITPANLSVLKNGRAKAVRFSTLAALCEVLQCQPGDLLRFEPDDSSVELATASSTSD